MARPVPAREPVPDHEQKQLALSYLHEAWAEARLDGVDEDCLAQASLFAAFNELVTTYGEEAAAVFAEGLAARIRNGEFSVRLLRQ
jgi:predicted YcjX-like family ATPase